MPDPKNDKTGQTPLLPTKMFLGLIAGVLGVIVGSYWIHSAHQPNSTGPGILMIGSGLLVSAGALLYLAGALLARAAGALGKGSSAAERRVLGVHKYRDAVDSDFYLLDRDFYEAAARDLNTEGFRAVRDIVNVTLSEKWPRIQGVQRCFIGDSGTTMACVGHLRVFGFARLLQCVGLLPRSLKIVDCDTELSDGTLINTSNMSARVRRYPFIDRLWLPARASAAQIIREHRAHVASFLGSKRDGAMPVLCQTYKDLRASQDRIHLLKGAYRRAPDFDLLTERQRLASR